MEEPAALGPEEIRGREAWRFVCSAFPELGSPPPDKEGGAAIASALFKWMGTTKDMFDSIGFATFILRRCEKFGMPTFASHDVLVGLTENEFAESSFPARAGVYIFIAMKQRMTIKVGESGNCQSRVVRQHLKYGGASTVRSWYEAQGRVWPQAILDDELSLLLFWEPQVTKKVSPFGRSERLLLEDGLTKRLKPVIPGW